MICWRMELFDKAQVETISVVLILKKYNYQQTEQRIQTTVNQIHTTIRENYPCPSNLFQPQISQTQQPF